MDELHPSLYAPEERGAGGRSISTADRHSCRCIQLGVGEDGRGLPGTSLAKLAWLVAWHIRDESYAKGQIELVNAHHQLPFAAHWGEGTTSSSDGQRFRAGGHGESAGNRNAKYGSEPGVLFYTHLSDQYAPFYTKVINANVRDATHVLDGLLYHESQLRIEEHYTDTAGFTDHVFALFHPLGFEFAPRISDLADKRVYIPGKSADWPALAPLIGGSLNLKLMEQQFDEFMRLVASIKQGTVTASLILRKLASYPRQNSLALAVRESVGSSGLYSCCVTSGIHRSGIESRQDWQKANRATPSPTRFSSIAWGKSATVHTRTSDTEPVASTWLSPPSPCGTPCTWSG